MAKTAWMRLVQKHIGTLKRQGVRGKELLGAAIAKAKAEYVPKTLTPLVSKTKRRSFHKRSRGTRRRRY